MNGGEDIQTVRKAGQVALEICAVSFDFLHAVGELLRRIHVGDPAVAVAGGTLHRDVLSTRHPDRRARLLDRERFQAEFVQGRVTPVVGDIGFRPGPLNDF